MGLRGQGSRWSGERGYAMAALLVGLAVMAVLMSVAMPVWRHQARREKEAELVFRGEQYARAIALYNYKMSQQTGRAGMFLPPSIDVLVEGRYLRKKYKDPMTKDGEFLPLQQGNQPQLQPGQTQPGQAGAVAGAQTQPQAAGGRGGQVVLGGIMGVRSKSEENSIRSYRGQTRYDQWQFIYLNVQRPGGAAGMATPDGRGGPGSPTTPGFNPTGRRGGTPPFGGGGAGGGTAGPRIGPGTTPGGQPPGGPAGGRRGPAPGGRGPGN